MIKKQNKKVLSGMAGATLLLAGCASAAAPQAQTPSGNLPEALAEEIKETAGPEINGYKLEALAG